MADNYNINKIKSLLKYASSTGQKLEQNTAQKQELEKQVKKIQTIATKKGVKREAIIKTLKELQDKLNQVLASEGKFLVVQGKDELLIQDINSHIKDMENNFIQDQQKIQEISNSINELKAKVSQVLDIKQERDMRMQELEEKIKSGVNKNFQEILKIEQQIVDLEEKYNTLSNIEKIDSESLKKIRDRIEGLKDNLEVKKQEYEKKSKIPLPEIRPKPILPPKPSFRKPEIRHEMHITPIPEIIKQEKPMPPKKPLFKKVFRKKEPEPIWKEKFSLKGEEGIRLKPEEEIEFKPKEKIVPPRPAMSLFEKLPELPELPREIKPSFSEMRPKIRPEKPLMPPPPIPGLEKELPPIPEPPRPPRLEEEITPLRMAQKKPSFWNKIKSLFRKKKQITTF